MAKFSVTNLDSIAVTGGTIDGATITGGTVTGITDLAVADGGTGASSGAIARDNIGLGDLSTLNSPLQVVSGGTGASSLTDHGILVGSGSGAITASTPLTAGQMIYGVDGADPGVLGAGDTTNILVGGGAGAPVWTEATGSGAPVRATSPTFGTQITTPLVLGGISTTSDLSLQTTSASGTTGSDMHFLVGNNGATEAMTILNSGKVGIGTPTPGKLLDVGSGTGTPYIRVNGADSGTGTGAVIAVANGGVEIFDIGNYSAIYGGAYSNVATIYSPNGLVIPTGNVGIGTPTPNQKLTVQGSISLVD